MYLRSGVHQPLRDVHAHDGRPMSVDGLDLLPGLYVPKLDEFIRSAAIEDFAQVVRGQGDDRPRVVPQRLDALAAEQIPHLDARVGRSGEEQVVGLDRLFVVLVVGLHLGWEVDQRVHRVTVTLEGPDAGLELMIGDVVVPDPGRLVVRGGEHEVVGDQESVNLGVVPPVDEHALVFGDVPLADGRVGRARVEIRVVNGHASDVAFVTLQDAQVPVVGVGVGGDVPHSGSRILGAGDQDALVRRNAQTVDAVVMTLELLLQFTFALLTQFPC